MIPESGSTNSASRCAEKTKVSANLAQAGEADDEAWRRKVPIQRAARPCRQIGRADFRLCPGDADGAYEQRHAVLLCGKDMLDAGAIRRVIALAFVCCLESPYCRALGVWFRSVVIQIIKRHGMSYGTGSTRLRRHD
jgi:hypothetical protein